MSLGRLLAVRQNSRAARTVFAQVVAAYPDEAAGHAALASLLVDAGERAGAIAAFERALALDAEHREAHRGLAILAERDGDNMAAQRHWRAGFPDGRLVTTPGYPPGPHVHVLLVASAVGGNIPLAHVLDPAHFTLTTLIAESFSPRTQLGDYDIVFNSIGDADRARRALGYAERALAATTKRIINPPALVRETSRPVNARRLGALDGIVMPLTIPFRRGTALSAIGLPFPFLVRSPGFHTGLNFVRVDDASSFVSAVDDLPGDRLLAIEYIDTRHDAGTYVKYRAMAIDGLIYSVHRAISTDWKIHAFTAQHEEAEPPLDDTTLVRLQRVVDALGLDYCGIDFAYDRTGRLVVFEANATMIARTPTVITAVQRMLGAPR
jgi:glutathione synthase/RimK-type ligase-like ATP-grasp enzyme